MLESNSDILLCFQKSQFKVFDLKSKISQIILTDVSKNESNLGFILAGAVSHCGNYLCVSDDLKGVYLYNNVNSEWQLLRKCFIEKRCSYIKFSHDNQYILIADKSGYVLRLPLEFENNESNDKVEKLKWIILGHVSLLIDFDLHPFQKLIATADRDEKIRVSFYPNSYEIYTFLLGHTKFVTQLKFSADGKRLYSAAADGFLMIWDLQTKIALCKHNYSSKESESVPMVTRMFISNENVFLFFKSAPYMQVVMVIESGEGLTTKSSNVSLSVPVEDVVMVECGDSTRFHIVSEIDGIRFSSFDLDKQSGCLNKVAHWLDEADLSDSPVSKRNNFLESLPKIPIDKTGLDVYFELKAKRLRLNGDKSSVHSGDEDGVDSMDDA